MMSRVSAGVFVTYSSRPVGESAIDWTCGLAKPGWPDAGSGMGSLGTMLRVPPLPPAPSPLVLQPSAPTPQALAVITHKANAQGE
jgi:hypothetical protein